MPKASDIRADTAKLSFLFKSSPGFGKTLAACSFAIAGPVHLAYWDKKVPIELESFFTKKRFGDDAYKILDNITWDAYSAENPNEYLNLIVKFVKEGCPYFALICDSITFMTASAVNWSINYGKNAKVHKNYKDVLPEWDEYKVETSLVSQCIDLSKKLPCHIIWTAHPLSSVSLTGSGSSITVARTNPLVSYGTKIASMIPGSFTEIYHFSQRTSYSESGGRKAYIVNTEAVGDEFAKSPILGEYIKEFDITDKLFYNVWKELIDKSRNIEQIPQQTLPNNPFNKETKWRV